VAPQRASKSIKEPSVDSRIDLASQIEHTMPAHHIVALRGDIEASLDPATELSCSACGSLAFRYPRVLDDDKPVICAGCGAVVSTYGELRQRFGEQD
jgi:hypothetical protein